MARAHPPGAVGQRLLDEPEITPLPRPPRQWGRHVVEPRALQSLRGVRRPDEDPRAATGTPTGRPGRRSRAPSPRSSSRTRATGPGRGSTPRMVASVNGANWASRRASVHSRQSVVVLEQPERRPRRPPARSGARRRRRAGRRTMWASRPSTSATRSSSPGRPGRSTSARRRAISVGASRCHSLDRAMREPRPRPACAGPALAQGSFRRPPILVHQIEPQKTIRRKGDGVRLLGHVGEGHTSEHLVGGGPGPLGQRELGRLGEPARGCGRRAPPGTAAPPRPRVPSFPAGTVRAITRCALPVAPLELRRRSTTARDGASARSS